MAYTFFKYHGAGNDFIMIDDREVTFPEGNNSLIRQMCDRHFGIGADGLILLRSHPTFEFEMIYFNSDGAKSSFCGNGSRAAVRFALDVMQAPNRGSFLASDGVHHYIADGDAISVSMEVNGSIVSVGNDFTLDTGSPHYVHFVSNIEQFDIVKYGKSIRYNETFKAKGINVNAVEYSDGKIHLRTYERGVEDETLACGTGVTAAALVFAHRENMLAGELAVEAVGGSLKVRFERVGNDFKNIMLTGPAVRVFSGLWE